MLAADCANVGLFCNAICCSSSSVIVFCSGTAVCAWRGTANRNRKQEEQSKDRVTPRSGATASKTGVVRLFIFVLHPRHVHVHWLIAFPLFSKLHDLVVFVLRQHAYERHHSRHEAAPAGTEAIGFGFVNHLIHRHHWTFHEGILRKTWHGIRILADFGLGHLHSFVLYAGHAFVLYRTFSFERRVGEPLFRGGADTHSAT